MKDSSSKRKFPLQFLVGLVYVAMGCAVGVINPAKLLGVILAIPLGILSGLIFKRQAFLYVILYVVGYTATMMTLKQ